MTKTNIGTDNDSGPDCENESRTCECCEEEFECDADSDAEYCDDCEYGVACEAAADRRYRRAESGYPDA